MRRFLRNGLIFVPVFLFIAIIYTSCYPPPSPEPCDGHVILVNPLPDTTMVVGQIIKRDLMAEPIVFQQTAGKNYFSYNILNQNGFIVNVSLGDLQSLLTLKARSVGIDTITIEAKDHCDSYAQTTFVVTVIDTSAH